MEISRTAYSQGIYNREPERKAYSGSRSGNGERTGMHEALSGMLSDRFGVTKAELAELEKSVPCVGTEDEQGKAPYSYLKNEDGVVEYKGVIFTLDERENAICLGDVSNPDEVISIPLENGGCLKVNRNSVGSLGHAIGMFSPADINRILRALKLDAKIQEMKKEIEEMEDGIGKDSRQQNAESNEEAEKVQKEKGNAGGFNGYGESEEKGIFELKEWQLKLLLDEEAGLLQMFDNRKSGNNTDNTDNTDNTGRIMEEEDLTDALRQQKETQKKQKDLTAKEIP